MMPTPEKHWPTLRGAGIIPIFILQLRGAKTQRGADKFAGNKETQPQAGKMEKRRDE